MKKKICKQCRKSYWPTSGEQLYCPECHELARNGEKYHETNESLKGGEQKMPEEKTEKPSGFKKKYGEDVEKKVLDLAKSGKNPKEISKELNGKPAVPWINRCLKKANFKKEEKN